LIQDEEPKRLPWQSDEREHDEHDEHVVMPNNFGTLLRNEALISETDLIEIDDLEHEIFGKSTGELNNFKVESVEEDGEDLFFDVFLTSEEYRRVVAAVHDQLYLKSPKCAY
jgi:hypothetical protein